MKLKKLDGYRFNQILFLNFRILDAVNQRDSEQPHRFAELGGLRKPDAIQRKRLFFQE